MQNDGEGLKELGHDPVPGYRTVFYIVFAVATAYLALILFEMFS